MYLIPYNTQSKLTLLPPPNYDVLFFISCPKYGHYTNCNQQQLQANKGLG